MAFNEFLFWPKVAEPHTGPILAPVAAAEVVTVAAHIVRPTPAPGAASSWLAPLTPPPHGALGSSLLSSHALQAEENKSDNNQW